MNWLKSHFKDILLTLLLIALGGYFFWTQWQRQQIRWVQKGANLAVSQIVTSAKNGGWTVTDNGKAITLVVRGNIAPPPPDKKLEVTPSAK